MTWLEKELEKAYELKTQKLGDSPGYNFEGKVLNRILRRTPTGLEMEPDPRHAEMLIKSFNLEGAKSVVTPGVKQPFEEEEEEEAPEAADELVATAIRQILSQAHAPKRDTRVSFSDVVEYREVKADRNVMEDILAPSTLVRGVKFLMRKNAVFLINMTTTMSWFPRPRMLGGRSWIGS